jgi:hypothetical protein
MRFTALQQAVLKLTAQPVYCRVNLKHKGKIARAHEDDIRLS